MNLLVTGGGGYLGCHVVRHLLDNGHFVRVFDRFCFGEEALTDVADHPNCHIMRGDIRRLQETPDLLEGIEGVVHLASLSNDPSCSLDEDLAEDINVESVRELANQALQAGVRRFIQASTCSVYGHGVFPQLDEESPTHPVSPYGATNLRAEQAVLHLANARFEPVVARLATLYGWSPRMRFDLAINQMTATAVRSGVVNVLGGGNQWRPFLHVRDGARALALLVKAPAETVRGQIYNVGDDEQNFQIRTLAEHVAEHFEVPIEVARDDDDTRTFHVQCQKLAQAVDFTPEHALDDGIAEVAQCLRDSALDPNADRYFNVRTLRNLRATPVEQGGEPMASKFVPLYRPSLGQEEEDAVVRTLRSGWLTSAARVPSFEKYFAEIVGAGHAVAVTSCTAAFHLALVQAGVKPGDEVIMPPLTWGSMANIAVHMGATPVFADIDPDTLNLDADAAEQAITERTRAIVPVHLTGQPCDLDRFYALGKRRDVRIIEDAAHALGASYKGKPIGSHGDFTCFSFYAIKNITTIDGGAVTVSDPDTAEWLLILAGHGMRQSAWDRYGRSSAVRPVEVVAPGFKYRLTDVSAAIGIEQLHKLPSFLAARTRLARMYQTILADIDEIRMPVIRDDVEHAWHLFVVRLRTDRLTKSRDEIREDLRRENIGTGLHFYGLHLHEYYRERYGLCPDMFPHATAASEDMLSLPLFPLMEDKHVQQVADALKKVLAHALRRGR